MDTFRIVYCHVTGTLILEGFKITLSCMKRTESSHDVMNDLRIVTF